jgi:hypothetical protein
MANSPKTSSQRPKTKTAVRDSANRFEPAKLDSLFPVLDAIAWMDVPRSAEVAQFAGIDPRTAGKLLKNAAQIGLVDVVSDGYILTLPYPYKGSHDQKEVVVKEALLKLPLLVGVRQFKKLGDNTDTALRKAATVANIVPFVASDLNPLLQWAQSLGALDLEVSAEDLVDEAEAAKTVRHRSEKERRIAFISHSSRDKPFVRQLASDLTAAGVEVWLDEQRIRVGDSIPEKIAQGLAQSDFFLIAVSKNSADSAWVAKELNNALINEVQRRKVHVLPMRLDDAPMPDAIADKKYANFSISYKQGLEEVLTTLRESE